MVDLRLDRGSVPKSINSPEFYTLNELLTLVRAGQIAMPEFQRAFVWTPAEVSELLVSIARRWPCGTFLLLEGGDGDAREFDLRPVKNGPDLSATVEIVVLDGQQRLTAVYHAFDDQARGEIHYVRIRDVADAGGLDEEHIQFERKTKFVKAYPTMESQARVGIIKVSDLVNDERFSAWIAHLPEEQRVGLFELRERDMPGFREYSMPAITLPRTTPLEALAKIFETINRTGQDLKTVDLMVAKLFPKGFKLRDRIDEVKSSEGSRLGRFEVPGIELLKLIALWERLRSRDPDEAPLKVKGVRESDVLNLNADFVIKCFDDAVSAYEEALHFVEQRCGAVRKFMIPSITMLLPVADALARGLAPDKLERWFWASTFAQAYSQGANTQALADARSLRAWAADDGAVPQILGSPTLSIDALRDARRRNEMLMRGLLCLTALRDARDWITGERFIDGTDALDVHHIFPRRYLETAGEARTELILNFTLLKKSTNQAIRDQAPAVVVGRNDVDNNLFAAHLVRTDDLVGNAWPEFLENRVSDAVDFLRNRFPWLQFSSEEVGPEDE